MLPLNTDSSSKWSNDSSDLLSIDDVSKSTSLAESSVADLIEKYQHDTELLKHILMAKAQEDKESIYSRKLAAEEIRQAEEARLHSKYIDLQLNQHKRSSQQLSLGETTTHERLDGPSSTSVLSTEDDWFSCSTGNNLPVILSPFVPPSRPEYAASNSPSIASGITTSPYMSFDTPFADLSLSTASSPEPNMAETSSAAQQRSEASSSSQTKKTSKRSFSFPGDPSRMQHQTKKSDTFSSTDTDEPLDHGKVMEALRAKLRRSSSPYHKGTQDQSTNTTSRTGVLLLNLKTRKKASAGRRGR